MSAFEPPKMSTETQAFYTYVLSLIYVEKVIQFDRYHIGLQLATLIKMSANNPSGKSVVFKSFATPILANQSINPVLAWQRIQDPQTQEIE